ncbi:MAG: TRAP transporter small permease subunit [Pseudomonadota bacterium]
MSALFRAADLVDAIVAVAGKLAAALILVMVALVTWNVLGRYVGGGAPVWAQELEWHLLLPVALIGIVSLMREEGHVRVDMIYGKLPARWRHSIDLVSMVCGAVIGILLVRYSLNYVGTSFSSLEGSPDPGGLPGRYVLKAMIPVCFALLSLQCAALALRHAAALTRA